MAINISLIESILELLPPEAIIDLAFKTAAALIYESILEWMPPESIMDLTFKTAMALMSHEKIRLVCMKIIILGFMGILFGVGISMLLYCWVTNQNICDKNEEPRTKATNMKTQTVKNLSSNLIINQANVSEDG